MRDEIADGVIGWLIAITIFVLFGIFILYWWAVRPNPLVRIPASIGLFLLVVLIVAIGGSLRG